MQPWRFPLTYVLVPLASVAVALALRWLLHEVGVWVWVGMFVLAGFLIATLIEAMDCAGRRAEAGARELHDSRQMLRSVLDTIPMRVFWKDRSSVYLGCNEPFAHDAGLATVQQVQGKTDIELGFPEADLYREDDAHVMQSGESKLYYEEPQTTPGGPPRWVRTSKVPLRDPDGRIIGVLGTYEDITAKKLAEEQLRESEERFRTLVQNAEVVFWMDDPLARKTLYISPSFERVWGRSPDRIYARYADAWLDYMHPEDRQRMREAHDRLLAGGPFDQHYRIIRPDGAVRWIHDRAFPLASHGAPRLAGLAEDVTERKQAEEAMAQSKLAVEAASQAKDRFLAMLSHELRTPLTPVLAAATVIERDARLPAETRDDIGMIRRNVELEARLIDDLLDLTRISRGKLELRSQPTRVCTVLKHALDVCASDIDAKGLHIAFNSDEGSPWVSADPPRLQQVFWNLIKNAVKFTPAGGCIGVRCMSDDHGQVIVEVTDSGVGIDPEVLPHIFNAFEQGGRRVTRDFGGLGLGLAISRALIDLHGGMITAHSKGPNQGALFRVSLPAIAPPAQPLAQPAELESVSSHPAAEQRPRRILLVEDHADTARIMSQLLRAFGYEVRTAGTVASALELAGSEDFDLILSDLGLPDGSGLDVICGVHKQHPHLKGIALSGFGMDEDIARSHQAGFIEHVTKPVNFDELRRVIDNTIG